jgi:hypothetical protein
MATAIWQGAEWHEGQAATDQGRNNQTGPTTRRNEDTQILELLTFSENRKTKEDKSGTKHIGATDLLKEMTRRRAANSDWDDAATIAHCARSFKNNVAVWWQEVVPSDNGPKQFKKINTSRDRFESVFRRAWIIETTLPPQSWLDKNPQNQDESLVDFITRVQEASLPAAMAEIAIKGAPKHRGKEDEPPGNDHTDRGIATFDQKGVAPQRPQESIAAYVTRVQMAVATQAVKQSHTQETLLRTATHHAGTTGPKSTSQHRQYSTREQWQDRGQTEKCQKSHHATMNRDGSSSKRQDTSADA